MKTWKTLILVSNLCILAGCDNSQQTTESASELAAPTTAPAAEVSATVPRAPAPADAQVFFVDLENGAIVSSPLTVVFGAEGIAIAAAGTYEDASGHHHLLVDAEVPDPSLPVPKDDNHIHFGKGQTEAVIELSPGEHTLQLVLGDGNHIPLEPSVLSEQITITVE
ncbi:MAG: DUF4399 domain-containing protein [Gammaproteobacteria bacterium]